MSSQMNLSELTTQQITDLLWVLKGTPQAQALYEEYSSRSSRSCIAPDDPDWEAKVNISLQAEFDKSRLLQGTPQAVRKNLRAPNSPAHDQL